MRLLYDVAPPVLLVAAELFALILALTWAVSFPFVGAAHALPVALVAASLAAVGGGGALLRRSLTTARAPLTTADQDV